MAASSAGALLEAYPETLVEIHPEDATKLGLEPESLLRIKSRRGEVIARAIITNRVAPGIIFGNFHFPGEHNINNLTIGAVDPIAKIPEYKVCAVKVEAVLG
jgi:anaerobic selenocysteine-containing dehydrogenase